MIFKALIEERKMLDFMKFEISDDNQLPELIYLNRKGEEIKTDLVEFFE